MVKYMCEQYLITLTCTLWFKYMYTEVAFPPLLPQENNGIMHPHNTIDVCVYSLQHQFPGSLHCHPDLPHSRLCRLERTKKSKHFSTYNIFHAVQDEHKQYLSQLWTHY